MCESLEELYLLEFYVDVVKYKDEIGIGQFAAVGPDDLGETFVNFKYFGSNRVQIREEDFCPSTKPLRETKRKVPLKTGKSCLFSLKSLIDLPLGSFDVEVNVYRKILDPETFQGLTDDENWEDVDGFTDDTDNDLPVVKKKDKEPKTEFLIGRTDVSLYESFKYLKGDLASREDLDNSRKEFDLVDTIDRSFRDGTAVVECHSYLRDAELNVTGEIVYLVRTSCFGRTILTQFQLSDEEAKSYLGKRTDRNVCANNQNGYGDGGKVGAVGSDMKQDGGLGVVGVNMGEKEGKIKEGVEEDKLVKQGEKGLGEQLKQSKPAKNKKLAQSKGPPECPYGFDENGEINLKTLCECMCRCVMDSVQNNQPNNQTKPADQREIPSGSVGMVGNQMILRMPDKPDKLGVESKFTSSVFYTQGGEDVGENIGQVVNVRPEYPHMMSKDDPDAKQDVLVLKLGRKRIAAGKKPRIEIEMRTPKFKDEKPETVAKETQYLVSDLPKPSKGPKSQKSGKGGKKGRPKSAKSGKGKKKK